MPTGDRHKSRVTLGMFGGKGQIYSMPLKLLVLSELTPRDIQTGISSDRLQRVRINKDNFNEVMEQFNLRVVLEIPNRLADAPQDLLIELSLENIKSFRPEAIVEQVTELRDLWRIRQLLVDLRERKVSRREVQQCLSDWRGSSALREQIKMALSTSPAAPQPTRAPSQPSKVKPPTSKDALDTLFDMVEVPETLSKPAPSPRPVSSTLGEVISLIAGSQPSEEPVNAQAVAAVIADLDATLSAPVNEILHHPEFRRLESAWRGLKFLVDRTDFREDIQIEVLSLSKDSLSRTFDEYIFQPEYEKITDASVSVIIADYEFDNSPPDIDLLRELSEKVERLQTPFISSIGPSFFVSPSAIPGTHEVGAPSAIFEGPEHIKWKGFRRTESSRWLALVFNRFLLRLLYGVEGNRVKVYQAGSAFDFQEETEYLWGNPVWALASLLTASFARTGWCTQIIGVRYGAIENLPVWEYPRRNSHEKVSMPLEFLLPEQKQSDLAENGIIALTCRVNSDAAIVFSAPTVHLPERYAEAAESLKSVRRAALSYQLFASRITHYVERIQGEIIPGNTPEGIKSDLARALSAFIGKQGEVAAEMVESEEQPGCYELVLSILPGREIMPEGTELELRLRIR
ncbi:MAG: type VI secretion system contractile sheath large subunit [bacterium]